VGQAVYALADFWRDGSDAEYIVMAASDLAPKPEALDFNQAAAIPLSALTAWQGLFDYGMLAPGQKVLDSRRRRRRRELRCPARQLAKRVCYWNRLGRQSPVSPHDRSTRDHRLQGRSF
jgi:hypothetical protein